MSLSGKVAIVTGAGRGIGEATAARFAEEGAAVACVDVNREAVELVATLIQEGGGEAVAIEADISTEEGNAAMVEATISRLGGLDVLHANAAVQYLARIDETPAAEIDRLYATNLRGASLGIKHAIPRLRERGGGSIILTASVLGLVGDPDLPAYGAMKGGVRALCRAVATAHGPENIRCNTICPADVETEMNIEFFDHQPDPEAARREIMDRYPLHRFASPRDVANVAVFLASDEASYLSGIDVLVDGGLLARVY